MGRGKILCLNFSYLDLRYEFYFITSIYLVPGCFTTTTLQPVKTEQGHGTVPTFSLQTQPGSHTHHFCSHFFGLNAVTSAYLAAKVTEKSSL